MGKHRSNYSFERIIAWTIFLMIYTTCGYPTLEPLCGDTVCGPGEVCAANQPVCIDVSGCGNGIVDIGEICDDGNILDGQTIDSIFIVDQCNHDCTSMQVCGNGIQDIGETCDHGKSNGAPNDICDSNCQFQKNVCGNGITEIDNGEQCDNSNGIDSTTCDGNDNGNNGPGSCRLPVCGDGYANAMAGEACDGGSVDTSTCNGSNANPTSVRCQLAQCGDNHRNAAAGEDCDSSDGSDTNICNGKNASTVSCRFIRCGDGYINRTAGEQCEKDSDCITPAKCNSSCECN